MQNEDIILFNEIKNRNLKVYKSLFGNYYPQLVKFAEVYIFDKQASEDIVQDLFIYFWENAEQINLDFSIKAYLFQSVKNRCLNYLRDIQIHDRHNLLYLDALLKQESYEDFSDSEFASKVSAAIGQLPNQMSEIFRLKYIEGKKLSEIAQIKHITENTVKTQLQRAKEKLRKILFDNLVLKNSL